jgi:DNA-binding beta-propeller fold protein YncE
VSNQGDGSVTVLQASNGQITETLALTKGASPYGVAFDGSAMWVANFNGSVAVCYPGGGSCGGFSLGANPLGLAFDGTNMWVTNHGGNSVTKIQVHGPGVNILGTYSVGVQPYGIAFDGTYMWVARSVPVPVRVDPSRAGVPRRRAPSVGVWAAERPDQDHWARHGSC